MSYEEDMRNVFSGVPDEFEPLQKTLDVWMDLPEPEPPSEEPVPGPETEPVHESETEPEADPEAKPVHESETEPAPEPKEAEMPVYEETVPEETEYYQTVMPEYTAESEEEIADTIAQAVEVSFHGEPEFQPESQIGIEKESAEETESVPEGAGGPEAETAGPEAETAGPETPPAEETPVAPEDSAEQKEKKKTKPVPKPPARKKKAEVHYHLPPKPKKIPRGSVHTGFLRSLNETMEDIRARQREDLPGSVASLKTAEKRYTGNERLSRKLNIIHTVVLILMILALLGRRFNWMLLGFLGGTTGAHAAVILTLIAMIAAWRAVIRALRDAVYMRFSYESLLFLTTLLSILEALAHGNTMSLLPLLAIGWCLCGKADLMLVRAKLRSVRCVINGQNRTGVRVRRRLWEKMDCIGKAPAGTRGFVRHLEERDSWSTGWSVFSIILLALSLIIGAYLAAKTGTSYLTILVTLLTVTMPVAAAMSGARSFFLLSSAMGRHGALAGWYGAKMLSGRKTVLAYDSDLFPSGTITHRGVRVYGNQTPQLLISYGASMVERANNGLTEPFMKLLSETGGQIHHVSGFQVTEGGLSGQIHGVFVAVGTYNFMQLMGAMPPQDAPKNGLFIALNHQIAGLFAIRYRVKAGSVSGFRRFTGQPWLTPLAAMRHLCVNPSYLRNWFKIPVGEIICPKVDTRWKLSAPGCFARGTTCGFIMAEGINPYSRLVAGARRMHTLAWIMSAFSIVTSLAMLFATVSRIAAGIDLLSAGRLLLVQLLTYLAVEIGSRYVAR